MRFGSLGLPESQQRTGYGSRIWAKNWLGNTIWGKFGLRNSILTLPSKRLPSGHAEKLSREYAGLSKTS